MLYLLISAIILFLLFKKDEIFSMSKNAVSSKGLDFNLDVFTTQLVGSESSDNYNPAYNGVAYGRYQFTIPTIKRIADELHIKVPTVSEFLDNQNLQDIFFKEYVNDILYFISKKNLNDFIGQKITGKNTYKDITTNINIYGLIAGAWLGGEMGLYNFLVNNKDVADKFNTYISDYVTKFSYFNNLNV
jgi:hypothetical protein